MSALIPFILNRLGRTQSTMTHSANPAEEPMLTYPDFSSVPPTDENVTRCDVLLQRLLNTHIGVASLLNIPVPWIKLIQDLKLTRAKFYVAVVGATGEGKSSLINVLLHEKKLIPTSCMRACTSAVTELSYNDLPGLSHRSQVDFITADEWYQELMLLLGDIQGDRVSSKDSKSPAAIALAKITAVYPSLDASRLGPADIDRLMSLPAVHDVLGTVKNFEATSGNVLHDKITNYIDSKEEGIEASEKMQLWPLIRKVSIQTRAPALEHGTVIVDLPGLLDSNAARASIAQNYLQRCDAVWFVANINRARDNATAKSFFEKELKRQLHLDGTISQLSFICSKTDDIKLSEVRDAFQKSADASVALQHIDANIKDTEMKHAEIYASLNAAELSLQEASNLTEEMEIHLSELRRLKRRAKKGEAVWPLKKIEGNSRKRASEPSDDEPAPKRSVVGPSRSVVHKSHTSSRQTSSQKKQAVRFEEDKLQLQLSKSDIEELIEDLEDEAEALRSDKHDREEKFDMLKELQDSVNADLENLRSKEWQTCVAMRNTQVTTLIRQKFAEDINEFYVKQCQDEDDFDPTQHESIEGDRANDLPVYCISSRGYEEICGWHGTKNRTEFANLQQTQIPRLVEHARQLGRKRQNKEAEKYLHKARSILMSMRIWSDLRRKSHMAGPYAVFNDASQTRLVDQFWTDILEIIRRTFDQVKNVTQTRVLSILASAGKHGAGQAHMTAKMWRENAWNTYQAACRHRGYFISSSGRTVEFNNDLAAPFMDYIVKQWARLFNQTLTGIFNGATLQGNKVVAQFKEEFAELIETYGCLPDDVATFNERLSLFLRGVDQVLKTAGTRIHEKQRGINRQPVDQIKSDMLSTYEACALEHGSGMYNRMKNLMESSIDRRKNQIFRNVTGTVDLNIDNALNEVTKDSLNEIAESWDTFRRDCAQFIAMKPTAFATFPANAQFEIRQALDEADVLFSSRNGGCARLLTDYAENAEESCMFFPEDR